MQYAFVVQLSPACGTGESFTGRAESVRSGVVFRFQNAEQLVEFLRSTVAAAELAGQQQAADSGI